MSEIFNVTFNGDQAKIETNVELGGIEIQEILEKIQAFWNYKYEYDTCDENAFYFKKI